MAVLHNKINNQELKHKMLNETVPRTTISFYQYFKIADPTVFRNELYQTLEMLAVFGRIYVAAEGINAQISVPENQLEELRKALYAFNPALNGVRLNIAVDDDGKSFWVLRIKVREKIVADGIEDPDFDMSQRGKYLSAAEYNLMASDPDTVVVDMRNHYEYEVGHFHQAIEIPSDTFREQLPMAVEMLESNKDKNIIMYCTGGIRCEKASAYMRQKGFDNVFHLEGGIIEYTRQAREQELENKFVGKNFVFDQRLGERISDDVIAQCHQCGTAADTHTNCANEACHLLFIQCANCAAKYDGCCSEDCQQIVQLPAEERAALRAGIDKGAMIFNKAKNHPLRTQWNKE